MRSNLGFIASRIASNLAESGTDVRVRWREWPVNTPVDPVSGAKLGTPVEQTATVKAFLHFPAVTGNSEVKQFNEIELGDCIADFAADVALDGKGVSFEFLDREGNPLDGHRWVPKPISQRLAQSWGVVAQGVRLFRPVLLRKA